MQISPVLKVNVGPVFLSWSESRESCTSRLTAGLPAAFVYPARASSARCPRRLARGAPCAPLAPTRASRWREPYSTVIVGFLEKYVTVNYTEKTLEVNSEHPLLLVNNWPFWRVWLKDIVFRNNPWDMTSLRAVCTCIVLELQKLTYPIIPCLRNTFTDKFPMCQAVHVRLRGN